MPFERHPVHARRPTVRTAESVRVFEDVRPPHLVVQEVEPELRLTLGLDVQLPLKRPDLFWSCQAHGQSPLLGSVRSTQNQGPFPPPALPGFHGTLGPSDAHRRPSPTERLRVNNSLPSVGLPCCDALCLYVPPPLPRRVTRSLGGCPGSGYSGLPRVRVRSALATALSGPAQGSLTLRPAELLALLSRAVVRVARRPQLPGDRPPVATRLNRPTASAGLPPARSRHLSRRTLTIWN